jgi:transposase
VQEAKADRQVIAVVFEELRGVRNLYRKRNGRGMPFRGRMNSWPFQGEEAGQYKGAWEGVPVITLSRSDRRGTTMDREARGETPKNRLSAAIWKHHRRSWCEKCGRWMDRDLIALLNVSRRGRGRFAPSSTEGEVAKRRSGTRNTAGSR